MIKLKGLILTREEAKRQEPYIFIEGASFRPDTIEYNRVEYERIINKIYDDFESRTCENCKYFAEWNDGNGRLGVGDCIGNISISIESTVPDYFGCNEFEPKNAN